jgi:replicative DNA helicase
MPDPFIDPTADLMSPAEARVHFEESQKPVQAFSTGFPAWDASCRDEGAGQGIALGWYVVIGGDTGHGKSLLALQVAAEAMDQGYRVGFVNLEMSVRQLRNRLYSMITRIPAWKLEPGPNHRPEVSREVVQWLEKVRAEVGPHPFLANREPLTDYGHVTKFMDCWRVDHGCKVFVVDYLQLCEAPEEAGAAAEIKRVSKVFRDYAHRHRVAVIALSQYNNESGNDAARKPHPGSLYGGRRIAQDSDLSICIDHSRYARDDHRHEARTWLVTIKNRHGPRPEIPILWEYETLTAREAQPDEEHLWPGV